jgi:hypothetical protein
VVDVPMDERSTGRPASPSTNTPLPPKRGTRFPARSPDRDTLRANSGGQYSVPDLTTAFDLIDDETASVEVVRPVHGASVLLVDDEDSLRRVMKICCPGRDTRSSKRRNRGRGPGPGGPPRPDVMCST